MPYRIDLFAIFIFLGVVQGIFLSFFFFSKEGRQQSFNIFHGLMLLSIISCLFEVFMMYTGYIQQAFYLVDFSEPMALMIGPFFYLFVRSLIAGKVSRRLVLSHLSFPILYALALIPFLITDENIKYNAWINAYYPTLPLRDWNLSYDPWMFVITEHHTLLTLISLTVYTLLAGFITVQAFVNKKSNFWNPQSYALKVLRNGVIQLVSLCVLILAVKIFFKNDTGDHLTAAFGALLIYATSFSVVKNSNFFKQVPITDDRKYKNTTIDEEERNRLILIINKVMSEQKPFLQNDFALPKLAVLCKTSVHTLSQLINEAFGKNFFEWMAEYRVEEAKAILKSESHLKIEEVAERVGYSSKSSFNTVFKKVTGKTPSEYRSEY